jgi:hypothetical protein
MKRVILYTVFLLFLGLIIVQLYKLNIERLALDAQVQKVRAQATNLEEDNARLQADVSYYSQPRNLMKEFLSLFNYRAPQEKLFIIVPPKESSPR